MVWPNPDSISGMAQVVAMVDGASMLTLLVGPFADIGHILYNTCGCPFLSLATRVLLAISFVWLLPMRSDALLFRNKLLLIPYSFHPSVHTFPRCRRFPYGTIFLRAGKSSGFGLPYISFHVYASVEVATMYLRNRSFPLAICLRSACLLRPHLLKYAGFKYLESHRALQPLLHHFRSGWFPNQCCISNSNSCKSSIHRASINVWSTWKVNFRPTR